MLINDTEFIVYDVETTGLSVLNGDRIVEIAAVRVKNLEIVDEFDSFVNPQRDIPQEATNINGITNEMVADAPTHDIVLPQMMDFIGGGCLVGHNVAFDLKFLCCELAIVGRKLHRATPAIDTLKMAKKLIPYLTNYRLGHLATTLGVKVGETHRALADVKITASVLTHLIYKAKMQQLESFPDLHKEFGVEKPQFSIEQASQETLF